MAHNRMRPIHPGEVLREEYLAPLGLSVNALAMALHVPATRLHEIVNERRRITADTALRLARYFGDDDNSRSDAQFWLTLQAAYDLRSTQAAHGEKIEREVIPIESPAAAGTWR